MTLITELKSIGPALKAKLAVLGIQTVENLLFHLPRAYEDRSCIVAIRALQPGASATVHAKILSTEIKFTRKRRLLLCHVTDGTGVLTLKFFHFYENQRKAMQEGMTMHLFGAAIYGPKAMEMVHPEYRIIIDDTAIIEKPVFFYPVYPQLLKIPQSRWLKMTSAALKAMPQALNEYIPQAFLKQFALPSIHEALQFIHRPALSASLAELNLGAHPMQRRLAFEELLAHRLSLMKLKAMQREGRALVLAPSKKLALALQKNLPFQFTQAQQRAIAEISADLQLSKPMLRLLQGDVGAGKTLVALMAIVQAVEAGFQAVFAAPTEILAQQHFEACQSYLSPLGIQVGLLTGGLPKSEKTRLLKDIALQKIQIIVGTHALFEENVAIPKLALMVVDEQHRFGVRQRLSLKNKTAALHFEPHQLMMSATPIPRTLAMTLYADLAVSTLDELPPGRQPIITTLLSSERRPEILQRLRDVCAEGRQVYWVCNLIEESDTSALENAEQTFALLKQSLPSLRIALIHGKMKKADKAAMMAAFKTHEVDILVATTVIEVGVDVPNASVMVIENAERMGLSQLHQLRGRVGRGATQSFCVLLYQAPLSPAARARLQIMRESQDGFMIAEKDLELRGPGEFLGTRQKGDLTFQIANIVRDQALIPKVQQVADAMLKEAPENVDQLIARWFEGGEAFGKV